jgi:hypothetical protein
MFLEFRENPVELPSLVANSRHLPNTLPRFPTGFHPVISSPENVHSLATYEDSRALSTWFSLESWHVLCLGVSDFHSLDNTRWECHEAG